MPSSDNAVLLTRFQPHTKPIPEWYVVDISPTTKVSYGRGRFIQRTESNEKGVKPRFVFWAYSALEDFGDPHRNKPTLETNSRKNSKLVPVDLGFYRGNLIYKLDLELETLFQRLEETRGQGLSDYDRTRPFFARAVLDHLSVNLASDAKLVGNKKKGPPMYPRAVKRLLENIKNGTPWDAGFQHRLHPPSFYVPPELRINALDHLMIQASRDSTQAKPKASSSSVSAGQSSTSRKRPHHEIQDPKGDVALAPPTKKDSTQQVCEAREPMSFGLRSDCSFVSAPGFPEHSRQG